MIAGERHSAWLADRGAQKRSDAAARLLAREWSRRPLLRDLDDEVTATRGGTADDLIAVARRFFSREDELRDLFDAIAAACRADPFFVPPLHPLSSEVHAGLLLYDHPELAIAVGVTPLEMLSSKKIARDGPRSIAFNGVQNVFRYIKAGGARLAFWEAPQIAGSFHKAGAGSCRLTGRRDMRDGDEFVVDGTRASFIIEHARADIVYLQAMVRRDAAPLAAEYDSDTRHLVGAASTDETSSRVQMMATLLRHLDRADAVPVLRELLASPHFYTRWHMMRELLALDADAALPELRRMAADDPHPEVRAAAEVTLERFFPEAAAEHEAEAVKCPA